MKTLEMNPSEIIRQMDNIPIFKKLDDNQRERLLNVFELQEYDKEETIIHEGDSDTSFFIILQGKVDVMVNMEGREIFIDKVKQNDIFGESAIFSDVVRTASIVAARPVQVLKSEKDSFLSFIKKNPDIGIEFLLSIIHNLMKKLRKANQAIAIVRDATIDEQIAEAGHIFVNLDLCPDVE
jgi:CRP-like cAMP-binding protein